MSRRVAAAALLTLPAGALAACGSTDRVDRHELEAKIAAYVQQRTGSEVAVRCPEGIRARDGASVRCSTVLSGAPMVVDLRFTQGGHVRITRMRPQ
ncbi:MAG TPA: DUF4333 domain-containing protein [Baekduia sp.]|nr:DUF4333 domain-containing protein [Baekduia sp.]